MSSLIIENLHVSVENQLILHDLNLELPQGEVHAIMGPNGTGKSTLAFTLMGHPHYKVESGSIKFNNIDLLKLSPEERSRLGIFLAFQYPVAIPAMCLFLCWTNIII